MALNVLPVRVEVPVLALIFTELYRLEMPTPASSVKRAITRFAFRGAPRTSFWCGSIELALSKFFL